jgi:hypothetical protein
MRGLLLNGKKIRRSAQTSNWEGAEKLARKLETDVDPEREKIEARREFTLREAVETFLGDQKARGLALAQDEAVRKLRLYWSKAGFWPIGETGLFVMSMSQR